jgi:hypothetical protein
VPVHAAPLDAQGVASNQQCDETTKPNASSLRSDPETAVFSFVYVEKTTVTAKVRLSPAAAKCLLQTIKEGSRATITSGCSDVWKEGRGQSPSSVISVLLWILLLARERQGGRVQRAAKRQVEEKLGRRRWNRAFAGPSAHPRGSSAVGRPRLAPDAHPPLVRRRPPRRPRGSPAAGLHHVPEARPPPTSATSPRLARRDEDKVVSAQHCELGEASVEGVLVAWRGRVAMREKF